jgi:hypothetical protein
MQKKADKKTDWREEMKIYYRKFGYKKTKKKFSPLSYPTWKYLGELLHGETG